MTAKHSKLSKTNSSSARETNLLSWSVIKSFFAGRWVELYQVDWSWDQACPTRACVRNHAHSRRELMAQIERSGALSDSVIVRIEAAQTLVAHNPATAASDAHLS